VGEDGGTHYIIMELVRGANLCDRLKQQGPMSLAESIAVVKQVAAGLEHAYEHGIVHRDIKPSNLVLEGQTVKILDLGLARKFDSGESITQEVQSMGTPDYMSPEQFQDAHRADIRSDLYSLGCTWYTLLTGRPPFPSGDALSKAMAHVQKTPEPIQNLAPKVPHGIAAIISRLMAKDRDKRPQTPQELLSLLAEWQSHALEPTVASDTHPILLLQLPAVPQNGHGLWKIERGSLMLTGVDLYVDVTDRNVVDPEVVLFELKESDLHLVDTTITVMRGRAEGRSPVTAVKIVGERTWDPNARGDAPQPAQFELRNCMVRGTQKVALVDSRQVSIRLENCIVATPGTLIHLFHTRPLEYAHHAMTIEMAGCTFDTNGPLTTIDTRPFERHPVKADVTIRNSVICSGIVTLTNMPPQVLWQSPVPDEVVSTSVKWFGQDNCYINRGDCFKAKTTSGPIVSLAQTPDDWARQNFGQEVDWFAPPTTGIKLPRDSWDSRLPNDYPRPSVFARLRRSAGGTQERIGAEPKDVAVPRLYRK
jgi:hypothetical protein